MIEDVFGRSDGYVHTAEIAVHWREGNDVEKRVRDGIGGSNWREGKNGTGGRPATMHFNPNNEKMVSPYSGNMISRGNCRSMADFENLLSAWASNANYDRDDAEVRRVDFALDCFSEDDAPIFRKLCDLVIIAFCVRHGIEEKHQYLGETITTGKPKNCKADWGQLTIERYNKSIQQSGNGAIWRMELRYIKDKRRKRQKRQQTLRDMLEALADELRGIPAFYEEAQERLNDALYSRYQSIQRGTRDKIKINQFLYQNSERVFSCEQIRGFYSKIGVQGKKLKNAVKNYNSRHDHLYISKAQFTEFVEWIVSELEKWIKNDPFWTEKNAISDGSNAE